MSLTFRCASLGLLWLAGAALGAPRPRTVRFNLNVVNATDQAIGDASASVYAPNRRTSAQRCLTVTASHPFTTTVDGWNNQRLTFQLPELPPYGRISIRVQADVLLMDPPVRGRLSRRQRVAALSPEPFIESDDPAIRAQAAALSGGARDKLAERFQRWVADALVYEGPLSEARGAREAFIRKRGDCTEYTHLFVALCRAAGLPARSVSGYVAARDRAFSPESYHDWAEFETKGRWILADAQRRRFGASDDDYIAFRVSAGGIEEPSFQRYQVTGDGLRVALESAS
jgi:hypothetical protein